MLIGSVVTKLDIPHEPGEWVEVRKLNHKTLARAAEMRSEAGVASMKSIGAELLTAIRKAREGVPDLPAAEVTPDSYDRDLVLQAGVMRWSYSVPVSEQALGELDETTAKWLHREIILRSAAPLDPVTVGNATSPSTAS